MTKVLLMSGLGPYKVGEHSLDGTLFSSDDDGAIRENYRRLAGMPIDLKALRYGGPAGDSVLRPYRGTMPHLPTETLRSILESTGLDHELFDLEDLWQGTGEPAGSDFDVVLLSTSFICEPMTLRKVLDWIEGRFGSATIVLGGQYSNLKYNEILSQFPVVDYIVRGDAEVGLPMLLKALGGKIELSEVPNLVLRGDDGRVVVQPLAYIDLDTQPSLSFHGGHTIVPYESMRGCPFSCKYCSYPSASPNWRYKSVEKIVEDWRGYLEKNGTRLIRAMDSTFTVPPLRFKQLLKALPDVGIGWEAYSRANVINSREIVDGLEAARCEWLLIGFESMSEKTLGYMNKRVSVTQNERAIELLAGSKVDLRASFIVGYPGETPEEWELTHRFVVDRYRGRFGIHAFIMVDETMPVWEDAELHQIECTDPLTWKHVGMDSRTAEELREKALFETRWNNDHAVHSIWQQGYERPVVPHLDLHENHWVEKLIERLAFLQKDWGSGETAAKRFHGILDDLGRLGIEHHNPQPTETNPPVHTTA